MPPNSEKTQLDRRHVRYPNRENGVAPGHKEVAAFVPSGIEAGEADLNAAGHTRPLTVKLRGRAPRPDKRRRRILSFSAGGAKPPTPHGPLERLLGDVIGVCPACCLDHI